MRSTTLKPDSQSCEANVEAGGAVAVRADRQDLDITSKRYIALVSCLRTAADMIGFVVELPFRWKSLDLKPGLPVLRKLGYGLMLNAVTDMWLLTSGVGRENFDPHSITVVKNFIGYLNIVDDFFDDPKNKHAVFRFSKGHELFERRKQLFASIEKYDPAMQKKLKRTISGSAYKLMGAMARFWDRGVSNLNDALYIRENTAGEICRATAELFNVIHEVPPDKAKAIEEAYWNVGMVLQVHDDVGDVGKDAKEGLNENLVLQILNERPDEKARLIEALTVKNKCTFSKLTIHAPETAMAARDLQDSYLAAIPDTCGFERIKSLITITVSLRWRSVAFRSIIDKMDL